MAGSNGRLYVFNKRKSDKYDHHIHKVQQGGKDYGKELDLVPYSGWATGNWGGMNTPMDQENTEHPRGRAYRQGSVLSEVCTSQLRRVDYFLMNLPID